VLGPQRAWNPVITDTTKRQMEIAKRIRGLDTGDLFGSSSGGMWSNILIK
jgi:hypothetical protein